MIRMKVSQKMHKSTFGKRFAEVEIINDDIRICDNSGHANFFNQI